MDEEVQKMFSLHLSGDGISVEQQIERRVALQIVQIIMGGELTNLAPEPGTRAETRPLGSISLSLREYLDKVGALKKPDQITTIAHYICEFEALDDFGRDDIRSRFLTAREPLPGNFGRDFGVALKTGWIAEVHGKKNRFYVTAKGTQAISNNFASGRNAATQR